MTGISAMKIKFCGNCNPDVDPELVKDRLETMAVSWEKDSEVLIDGCSRECLTKKQTDKKAEKIVKLRARDVMGGNA